MSVVITPDVVKNHSRPTQGVAWYMEHLEHLRCQIVL